MKIGEIKAEHNFKVVCGHHSIIFDFETKSDCRNAMFSLSWYCERENNFYITSIKGWKLFVLTKAYAINLIVYGLINIFVLKNSI